MRPIGIDWSCCLVAGIALAAPVLAVAPFAKEVPSTGSPMSPSAGRWCDSHAEVLMSPHSPQRHVARGWDNLQARLEPVRKHPSLDWLTEKTIAAGERFSWQPPGLVAVLGSHHARHWGAVNQVEVSPDGKRIASWTYEDGVRLWDAETLQLNAWYPLARAHAFSPDGAALAVTEFPGKDQQTPQITVYDLSGAKPTQRLVLRRDGDYGSSVHFITFASTGKSLAALYLEAPLPNRKFDPSRDRKGYILWNWESGTPRHRELSRHSGLQPGGSFTPDGRQFLHGDLSGRLEIIGLNKEELKKGHNVFHGVQGGGFALSPNGVWLVTRTRDVKSLCLWKFVEGRPQEQGFLPNRDGPASVHFSRDGKLFAGIRDNRLSLWSLEEVRKCLDQGKEPVPEITTLPFAASSVSFGVSGKLIFSGKDGGLRLWDRASKKQPVSYQGHVGAILSMAFSSDGRLLATSGIDGTVRLWSLGADRPNGIVVDGHPARVGRVTKALALSPQGSQLVCLDSQRQGGDEVRVWDLRSKPPLSKTLPTPKEFWGNGVHFDPSGEHLLVTGRRQVDREAERDWSAALLVWPIANTHIEVKKDRYYQIGAPDQDYFNAELSATFSPDGRYLALLKHNELQLMDWPAQVLKQRDRIEPHETPFSLAFSADGKELLTCGVHGADDRPEEPQTYKIRRWGFKENRLHAKGSFDTDCTFQVAYALGDKAILCGERQAVTLRDKSNGNEVWKWNALAGQPLLSVAPDGRHLALANANGTIYIVRLKELPKR